MKTLTAMQAIFVREYRKDRNATRAAIAAGYSEKTAHSTGPRLLKNPAIFKALNDVVKKAEQLAVVDRAWVLARLRQNVERAMALQPVINSKGEETGVYKYDGSVANKALELLGKDLGMFRDKVDVNVQGVEIKSGFDKVHAAFEAKQQREAAEKAQAN